MTETTPKNMAVQQDIGIADVLEWQLPRIVLEALLKDRTTGKNIVWGTKDYERHFGEGKGFGEWDEIRAEQIVDRENPIIRPRIIKNKAEQRQRARDKAEVFTPAWVCNAQNNLVDAAWFGVKKSPFKVETIDRKTCAHGWKTNSKPIRFPKGRTWLDYVFARRLEEFLLSADRKNPKLAFCLPKIVIGIPAERLCLFDHIADRCRISSPPCVKDEGLTIDSTFEREVQECYIPSDVLVELLKDRTTGDNVFWMTDDYKKANKLPNAYKEVG